MPRGRPRKLTPEQIEDIRWFSKHTNLSAEAIGKRFGVSQSTILNIQKGKK